MTTKSNTTTTTPAVSSPPIRTREAVLDSMLQGGADDYIKAALGPGAMESAESLLWALCKSDIAMSLVREWREELRAEAYGKWVVESLTAAGYDMKKLPQDIERQHTEKK